MGWFDDKAKRPKTEPEKLFLDDEQEFFNAMDEAEEMEYFMREEAERDERERQWAEEAHKRMHEGGNEDE